MDKKCKKCGVVLKGDVVAPHYSKPGKIRTQCVSCYNKRQREIFNKKFKKEAKKVDKKLVIDSLNIDYPDSPTGRAYIGFAKAPLMKSKYGIGFQGAQVQNEDRSLIQCYECGEWLRSLNAHLFRVHKMNTRDYKRKHGLYLTEALDSDKCRIVRSKAAIKAGNINNLNLDHKYLSVVATLATPNRGDDAGSRTMQFKNNRGTCPAQLKAELFNYIRRYKVLPIGKKFSKAKTLVRRHGSINKAFQFYGLPTRTPKGPNLEYTFPDSTVELVPRSDQESLYPKIVAQCPELAEPNKPKDVK